MIAFDRFSKRFGPVEAITGLTMTVEPGEIVALLGPNGSGKTTSIKAAAGLIRPTSGDVRIGRPGRSAVDPSARACCSFLPQAVAFPDGLTGREVLDFYGRLRRRGDGRVRDVLKMTGLNGAAARPVATYSGGMKQRLGLAVAMLPESPVLLLDEPTAALDPDGLCAFYGLVERRRASAQTMLFSSHQMGDVERLADRIVVLIGGRMIASLTAGELAAALADRGLMRVTLDRPRPDLMPAMSAIARKVTQHGDDVFVVAPPAARAAVLDVLRNGGAEIRGLSAEEGRLDQFYRELVGASR
jgi:Cu-processing system ATP-binding protein